MIFGIELCSLLQQEIRKEKALNHAQKNDESKKIEPLRNELFVVHRPKIHRDVEDRRLPSLESFLLLEAYL